jgi:hypothetical protein
VNGEDGMNLKHVGLCALVVIVSSANAVPAQETPSATMDSPYKAGMAMTPVSEVPPPAAPPAEPGPVPQLSQYILGPQCDCCGPLGGNTIGYEIYLRNGVSLPFGPGPLAKDLDPGWVLQGGARVLFINPPHTAAWTVDLGIVNIYNHASSEHPATLNTIFVPNPNFIPGLNIPGNNPSIALPSIDVTFNRYNRTFASAAFGREWYLWDPANSCGGLLWRAGVDGGFRYGTSKLDLNELPHRTKVIGAPFLSAHTDLEWGCGACIWQAGFRFEWSYTFSEILQDQNNAAVHDIMLMLNLGVRF